MRRNGSGMTGVGKGGVGGSELPDVRMSSARACDLLACEAGRLRLETNRLQPLLRMKLLRCATLASTLALSLVAIGTVSAGAAVTLSPATEALYVKIDSADILSFHHYRRALVDGRELLLATLKQTAADQARLANYPGKLVVLEDDAEVPEGAPELLLYWNGSDVSAALRRGSRERALGVVSRTPLANHPDYAQMRAAMNQGSVNERRDAVLRSEVQRDLYQALRVALRYREKA